MERRFLQGRTGPPSVRTSASGSRLITGYGAVFYKPGDPGTEYMLGEDMVERIRPGAFDRALKEQHDCRALFNHDANCILGRVSAGSLVLKVDRTGLYYEIYPESTSLADDVIKNIRAGNIQGSSFSFVILDQRWESEGRVDVREILDIQLFDVGPVTFPAYTGTTTDVSANGLSQYSKPSPMVDGNLKWKLANARIKADLAALGLPLAGHN